MDPALANPPARRSLPRRVAAPLALLALALPLASAVPSGRAATTAGTTGPIATAVIVADFTDSAAPADMNAIRAAFEGNPGSDVTSYFAEASYGKMTVAPSFFGPFTLPISRSAGCAVPPTQPLIDAAAAGVTYSQFSRIVFVFNCPGANFGSATRIGPVQTPQGTVQAAQIHLDVRSASDVWSVVHELSHTLGDFNAHAGVYVCQPETFIAPSRFGADDECVSSEYGDPFDALGGPPTGKSPQLDPTHKAMAGWFTASEFPTVTQSGTFTLAPYEEPSSSQPLALNIPRGTSGTAFTLEYRQPLGFDTYLGSPTGCRDCTVTAGASIRLVKRGPGSGGGSDTQLLDTTPGTIPSTSFYPTDDVRDGALVPGDTFTDPEFGITITTVSAGPSGLTVRVTIPDQSCDRGPPTVMSPSPATQTGTMRSASIYTVTLANTDSSGCSANTFRYVPGSNSGLNVVATPDFVTLEPGASTTVSLAVAPQPLTTTGTYGVGGYFRSNSLGTADATLSGLSYTLGAEADTTAPAAPGGLTARALGSSSVALAWSPAADNVAVAGYLINRGGSLKTLGTTAFVDGQLSAGTTYSYSVQAFDRRGNFSPAATVSVTTTDKTDTSAPTPPILGATAGDHNLVVSWTASKDNVGVAYYRVTPCFVPGCALPSSVRSFVVEGLPTRTKYDVQVLAVDGDGNMSNTALGTYTVYTGAAGTTAPTPPGRLLSPSGSFGQVKLSWAPSSDDTGVAAYLVYRNNRRIARVTSTSYTDTLAACPSQYYVQAVDDDGSLSAPSARVWFPAPYSPASDSSPPTAGIVLPLGGATVSGTVDITTFAADDVKVTNVQLYVDGTMLASKNTAPYTFAWDTSAFANGTHWLYERAYDAAGNYGTTGVTTVSVENAGGADETPPQVEIVDPTGGATVSGSVSVSAEASDDVGVTRVDIAVDGTPLASPTDAPYAASWNAATAGPGPHTVTATARDGAGNTSTAVVTVLRPMPLDTTPPTVSITSPANGASISGTVQVNASAADAVGIARVELFVDGALAGALTSAPWSFELDTGPLAGGNHTLTMRARDAAGNSSTAEIVANVQKDTAAPSKPGTPKALALGTTQIVLWWTSSTDSVGVAAYDVYRDGVLIGTTTAPNFFDTGLNAGTAVSYQLFARDAAGNRSMGSSALSVKTGSLSTSGTTGTLAGVAFDPQGKPLANVVVKVTIGTTVKSAKTSNSGAWKFTSIPPGDYLLAATLTGYQPASAVATSVLRQTTLTVIALSR